MRWKVALIAGFLLAGCTQGANLSGESGETGSPAQPQDTAPAADPEMAARSFIEAWQQGDYSRMYSMLTPLTQDSLSEEAFTQRYLEIMRTAAVEDLSVNIVSVLIQNPRQSQVRYRQTLHSAVVGDIRRDILMELTRDGDAWKIAWSDSLILPELSPGRGLLLDVITPTRANIYDRKGLALAAETEAVALWIVPNQIGDEQDEAVMLSTLRRLLDFPSDQSIQELYQDIRDTEDRVNLGEVTLEEFQAVSSTLAAVGGVQWQTYEGRLYFGSGLAPHAVGYVSWIQEDHLEDYLNQGYQGDEYVGQMGIEFWYESALRGKPGGTLYLTGPNGQAQQALESSDSEPPYAVYTNLDRELQRHAKQAIEDSGFVGSVVVLERDTGAVLALASSPSFDPNLFDVNNPNSVQGLVEIFDHPDQALLNRATVGAYPPGSTFKMVTMAAALYSDLYQADTIYNCGLEFRELPGTVFYDWRYESGLPSSGEITLLQALERSCNPYFYHIGLDFYQREMYPALSEMAGDFGLGQPTGIEIDETDGLIPDPDSKDELYGDIWRAADMIQLAIGQSYLQVTPLQVARYIAAIGNGGMLYQPQLVNRVQNASGDLLQDFQPILQGQLPLESADLADLQEAMINVVQDPRATAYRPFLGLGIKVAGKTGTAQTGDLTKPHAWFSGYTFEERQDKPDIAVVVMLEHQGEGSVWAAPVFRRIVEAYFKGSPQSVYPWEARIRVPRTPEPTPVPESPGEVATATPDT